MKRLTLALVLGALVACLSFPAVAQAEHADIIRAAETFQKMVKEGRTENLMTRIELYSMAGLSYQSSLIVPLENTLRCKDEEQLRVMAGMYIFDMNYALAFGNVRAAVANQRFYKETLMPRLPVAEKVESTPANPNLVKKLLEDPNNPELRARVIAQATRNTMQTAEASTDEEVMDYVVDAFYGSLIEGLYVACTLAKTEEITPEIMDLFLGQLERFQLFDELFKTFKDDSSLEMIEFAERDGTLQTVRSILQESKGRLSQADIEKLLALVKPIRAEHAATCK